MHCSCNLEAGKLVSDAITHLPPANTWILCCRSHQFFLMQAENHGCMNPNTSVGKTA